MGVGTLIYEWILISNFKKENSDEHNHNDKDANQDGV